MPRGSPRQLFMFPSDTRHTRKMISDVTYNITYFSYNMCGYIVTCMCTSLYTHQDVSHVWNMRETAILTLSSLSLVTYKSLIIDFVRLNSVVCVCVHHLQIRREHSHRSYSLPKFPVLPISTFLRKSLWNWRIVTRSPYHSIEIPLARELPWITFELYI